MHTVKQTILARRTLKVKADEFNPLPVNTPENFRETVEELIQLAGQAPFHYTCDEMYQAGGPLSGKEPWRFHALSAASCRKLLAKLQATGAPASSEGIRQMLAAADALILVTWLPEPASHQSKKYYPNVKNMEHIAATGAAIQNLLLAATEMGITNYWSSGGILRTPKMFEFLGIPVHEILLGAVFLFPEAGKKTGATSAPGKNRELRSGRSKWMAWLEL